VIVVDVFLEEGRKDEYEGASKRHGAGEGKKRMSSGGME
jgi:hypothetical protein